MRTFLVGAAALLALAAPATAATAADVPSEAVPTAAKAAQGAADVPSDHRPKADKAATHLLLIAQRTQSEEPLDVTYLVCTPAGGTHPTPWPACRALKEAGGRFEQLKPLNGICTKQYDPVRVYAYGHWKGKPVAWVSKVFGNRCEANLATAQVYDY